MKHFWSFPDESKSRQFVLVREKLINDISVWEPITLLRLLPHLPLRRIQLALHTACMAQNTQHYWWYGNYTISCKPHCNSKAGLLIYDVRQLNQMCRDCKALNSTTNMQLTLWKWQTTPLIKPEHSKTSQHYLNMHMDNHLTSSQCDATQQSDYSQNFATSYLLTYLLRRYYCEKEQLLLLTAVKMWRQINLYCTRRTVKQRSESETNDNS